ncbi:thioredoxin-dependent thiol peroxidase [Clostridium saccharoperbutylacetonicum]|jgi:peroxiredoxin Q/BCP
MLEVGTKAPDFKLLNQDGKETSLSDFRGRKIVLYFYSKDNTAGCTKQACGFAERYPDFQEKGAEVIGISKDSVESHRKFADKYNLNFTLLSDTEKKVIEAYDVWKEKNMYGKKTMGVVRTTYLIDENRIIIKAFSKVNAAKNPTDMLETI